MITHGVIQTLTMFSASVFIHQVSSTAWLVEAVAAGASGFLLILAVVIAIAVVLRRRSKFEANAQSRVFLEYCFLWQFFFRNGHAAYGYFMIKPHKTHTRVGYGNV